MKKENNFGYKFLRNVLGPVWNFYYNAKVVGKYSRGWIYCSSWKSYSYNGSMSSNFIY